MKRIQILTLAALSLLTTTSTLPVSAANHFQAISAAQFHPQAQQQFHAAAAPVQQFHAPAAQFHMPARAEQPQFHMPAQAQQFRAPAVNVQQFRSAANFNQMNNQSRGFDRRAAQAPITIQPINNFANRNNRGLLDKHGRDRGVAAVGFAGAPVYSGAPIYPVGNSYPEPIYNSGAIIPISYDPGYAAYGYAGGLSSTADIDAQKTALAQQIQGAAMSRQISGGTATNLAMMMNQLNANEDSAVSADGGGLTPGDRMNILSELNNISSSFSQAVAYNG